MIGLDIIHSSPYTLSARLIAELPSMTESADSRTALVLYGSETGNAQDLAEELGRTTQRLHFSTEVVSLDNVEPVCLPYVES